MANLGPITVVFGKNGGGKSVMLRAIRDRYVKNAHYVIPERTGDFGLAPHLLENTLTPERRQSNTQYNYLTNYRSQLLSRIQAYLLARGNTRDLRPRDRIEDIEEFINHLLPDFYLRIMSADRNFYQIQRSGDNQIVSDARTISSGEAQAIFLGLDVLTIAGIWSNEGLSEKLLLIDEPEAHLHPDLQVRLADFLVRVLDHYSIQGIIATHSTSLLAALGTFGKESVRVIYFDRMSSNLRAERFSSVAKEMTAVLGGHALMGPLFGLPMLLVEGDDDYRIWSQVPRHDVAKFSVIPTNGEEIHRYQKSLEKVFKALRDDETVAGYALLDGDKPIPESNAGRPQKFVRYIKMNCHEAENLYLTDEVLADIGTTWEEVKSKVVAEASRFGNKSFRLRTIETWDRMRDDVKDIVEEVSRVIDSRNVHRTVRVGQSIGRRKPSGQLLEYLGQEVVKALWT